MRVVFMTLAKERKLLDLRKFSTEKFWLADYFRTGKTKTGGASQTGFLLETFAESLQLGGK